MTVQIKKRLGVMKMGPPQKSHLPTSLPGAKGPCLSLHLTANLPSMVMAGT